MSAPMEHHRSGATTRCEVCGQEAGGGVRVVAGGLTHVFDSFQCAIHRLAPECDHCGCRILGRIFTSSGRPFCSEGCAQADPIPPAMAYPLHLRPW